MKKRFSARKLEKLGFEEIEVINFLQEYYVNRINNRINTHPFSKIKKREQFNEIEFEHRTFIASKKVRHERDTYRVFEVIAHQNLKRVFIRELSDKKEAIEFLENGILKHGDTYYFVKNSKTVEHEEEIYHTCGDCYGSFSCSSDTCGCGLTIKQTFITLD